MFFIGKSKFAAENFCEDLGKNLYSFYLNLLELSNDNFCENLKKFTNIVFLTIDKHAPLEKLLRRQSKLCNKPWLTKSILISIKNKRKTFKPHYLFRTEREKLYFKKYVNVLIKIKTIFKKGIVNQN